MVDFSPLEPTPRSVYQTVINMFKLLAQQGDPDAIEALAQADRLDFHLVEDGDDQSELLLEQPEGTYLVTKHGATFIENTWDA